MFKKFFKRKPKPDVLLDDGFKIIIETDKQLSDDTRNTIINILKEGVEINAEPSDICIQIMLFTGISDPMALNITDNSIELIL